MDELAQEIEREIGELVKDGTPERVAREVVLMRRGLFETDNQPPKGKGSQDEK